MQIKSYNAIISGLSGAMASLCGKLSGGFPGYEDRFELKILFVVLMIICNAGVWTFFVKALHSSSSSLHATLIASSTNYLLSALLGLIIFHETTKLLWWCGTTLIITGLILVTVNDSDLHNKSD